MSDNRQNDIEQIIQSAYRAGFRHISETMADAIFEIEKRRERRLHDRDQRGGEEAPSAK